MDAFIATTKAERIVNVNRRLMHAIYCVFHDHYYYYLLGTW